MKIALNLIVSVLAVSGLLASASTHATDLAELPLKTAVKLTAEITGASRNALYDAALALRRQAP